MHRCFSRISWAFAVHVAANSYCFRSSSIKATFTFEFLVEKVQRNNQHREKSRARKPRKAWIRPGRTSQWWNNFMNGVMLEEEWKENFRMSKSTFFTLSDAVRPFLVKQCTNMRMPVSVEKQVAVTLYYLSDEGRYRKVANAFGLAKCAVSVIVRRVCTVISTLLGSQYISLLKTENELEEAVQQFYSKHGFPQCFDAVDGTHIFIKQPNKNATDFFESQNRFSVNVQATCNYKYCFSDVVVKWPGSVHDSRIFYNPALNKTLRDGAIPPLYKHLTPDTEPVPVCVLGDPAYPLLPYLMNEFLRGGNTAQERLPFEWNFPWNFLDK